MTPTDIIAIVLLLTLTSAVVWLGVDTWHLRRGIKQLDRDFLHLDAQDYDKTYGMSKIWIAIGQLRDDRSTTTDLPVPDIDTEDEVNDAPTTPTYRPVPPDFHRNR